MFHVMPTLIFRDCLRFLVHLYLVQLMEDPILRILNILLHSLLSEYFFQIKVLNQYQIRTPKNANVTCYIKNKKTLCNTLNWGN